MEDCHPHPGASQGETDHSVSRAVHELELRETQARNLIEHLETRLKHTEADNAALKRRTKELQKRVSEALGDVRELVRANELLRRDMEDAEDEIETLTKKNRELEGTIRAVKDNVEALREERDALRSRVDEAEGELVTVRHENASLAVGLDEKTHESYVFRCAVAVAFKLFDSLREKTTMRDLLGRIVRHLDAKRGGKTVRLDSSAEVSASQPDPAVDGEPNEGQDDDVERGGTKRMLRSPMPCTKEDEEEEETDDELPLALSRKKRKKNHSRPLKSEAVSRSALSFVPDRTKEEKGKKMKSILK